MTRLIGMLFLTFLVSACQTSKQSTKRPNILFIAIDDLRIELGCYGSDIARTPNLDALATQGLLFNKAYCQQAICGPSRASILTGMRPETSGIFHNYVKIRELNPDVITLPQHFKNNGYEAVYCGKIFHHGDKDDEMSWSRMPAADKIDLPKPKGFALAENQKVREESLRQMLEKYGEVARLGLAMGPAYEKADVPDNTYIDGYNTDLAIATMQEMVKKGDKPFFLGLGFNKPHLNWIAPKKYWDMYDRSSIQITADTIAPENGAKMGIHASFELRTRSNIPKMKPIQLELAKTLKHAYLACVSYVDAQIGRMLAAIDKAGIRENTIIIVWSDHGWHLGDMGIWGKATNYEVATRVPMIIWTPDMSDEHRGKKTEALVELIDIYPTLCDLAGIVPPAHLEGYSFKPLLSEPKQSWKKAAFSQHPTPALREWGAFPIRPAMRETFFGPLLEEVEERIIHQQKGKWDRDLFENRLMGYAMRTGRYRLVIWKDRTEPKAELIDVELYDHETDPMETQNIAKNHPKLVKQLLSQFDKGWEGNLPKSTP